MSEQNTTNFKTIKSKFKQFIASTHNEILTAIIIILVGVGSFGLGRLSMVETEDTNNSAILSASAVNGGQGTEEGKTEDERSTPKPGGHVVASKSGSKYHLPWCSGAKTIKEENKIWFSSYEEARAAGYLPAGNCKGIE